MRTETSSLNARRPCSITVIGWIFIAVGVVALAYHLSPSHIRETQTQGPASGTVFSYKLLWVCVVRAVAVLCGIGLLYGWNWARWGLVGWLAFHVVIGGLHSAWQAAVHAALFGVVVFYLFRPYARGYFRSRKQNQPG